MAKKRKKKEETEALQETAAPDNSGNAGRWVAIMLLVLGSGVFLYALTTDGPPAPANDYTGETTPATAPRDPGQTAQWRFFENPEAAHPLPVTLPPSQFKNAAIANTYAIAKEIPEILAQQPCKCGCDRTSEDHRSLLDCYTDEHASGCMICLQETVYASQMTEAGKSAEWIRDAILRDEHAETNIGN
jgi:hypothetical protein